MCEILPVLLLEGLETLDHERVATEIQGAAVGDPLHEPQGRLDLTGRTDVVWTCPFRMKRHQMAQRLERRPAWKTVVADVEQPTDAQLASSQVDDYLAVLARYPAPDAVKRDD